MPISFSNSTPVAFAVIVNFLNTSTPFFSPNFANKSKFLFKLPSILFGPTPIALENLVKLFVNFAEEPVDFPRDFVRLLTSVAVVLESTPKRPNLAVKSTNSFLAPEDISVKSTKFSFNALTAALDSLISIPFVSTNSRCRFFISLPNPLDKPVA